jgi:hypothetical protein
MPIACHGHEAAQLSSPNRIGCSQSRLHLEEVEDPVDVEERVHDPWLACEADTGGR